MLLIRQIVFEALSVAGLTFVTVNFDGYGDDGQIEDISAVGRSGADLKVPDIRLSTHHVDCCPDVTTLMRETSLLEAIENLAYSYLEQKEEGWEIDDGSYGSFEFDVATRTIELNVNRRHTSSHDYEF